MATQSTILLSASTAPRRGFYRLFPPATRAELWAGLGFLALSLLGAAWVIQLRIDALALEHDAINVEGKVVRLWKTQTRRGGWRHEVEYEYSAPLPMDAQIFRNQTQLPEPHFARLKDGGPIAVQVCRTDPANHQVVGEAPRLYSDAAATAFALGMLGLLALGGVINFWWWWVSHRKALPGQLIILEVKNVS